MTYIPKRTKWQRLGDWIWESYGVFPIRAVILFLLIPAIIGYILIFIYGE